MLMLVFVKRHLLDLFKYEKEYKTISQDYIRRTLAREVGPNNA